MEMAVEHPAYGQERVMNELRKKGVIIYAGGYNIDRRAATGIREERSVKASSWRNRE